MTKSSPFQRSAKKNRYGERAWISTSVAVPIFSLMGLGDIRADMEKSNLGIRVERIEKVPGYVRRDVRGIAELKTGMEALKESVGQGIETAVEEKAEKTENRRRFVLIAVTVAGGIPALIAGFLS